VFYAVRPVYEFDFRLLKKTHLTNDDQYLLKKKLRREVIETHASERILLFRPPSSRGVKGLYLRCAGHLYSLEYGSLLRLEMRAVRPSCKVVAIIASF